ncbi:MAG: hypothetical protein NW207_08925 [Cytophagales bacterium]|nr:hypothetical protein [Cytophagales bacterium]
MAITKYALRLYILNALLVISIFANAKEIPFTTEDRDLLLRMEVRMTEGLKALHDKIDMQDQKYDAKFSAIDQRFDAVQNQINFTNNLIITLIVSIIGSLVYMWWDRRTANAPLKDSIEEERTKLKKLLNTLKEYAENNPDFKKIFDKAAIL